jgi:hypothetical protein
VNHEKRDFSKASKDLIRALSILSVSLREFVNSYALLIQDILSRGKA